MLEAAPNPEDSRLVRDAARQGHCADRDVAANLQISTRMRQTAGLTSRKSLRRCGNTFHVSCSSNDLLTFVSGRLGPQPSGSTAGNIRHGVGIEPAP